MVCLLDYTDFMNLFEKVKKFEKEEPELAFGIYIKLTEEALELIKKCYIGDTRYRAKYKTVPDGPGNYKSLLDYRVEYVEAIAALSEHALGNLEKTL